MGIFFVNYYTISISSNSFSILSIFGIKENKYINDYNKFVNEAKTTNFIIINKTIVAIYAGINPIKDPNIVNVKNAIIIIGMLINPIITIILRKAYGLGAMAMAGGNFHESYMTLSWQTGEFGPMGLEASVELGFKKELESVKTKKERNNLYNKLVKEAYERGKAINAASTMEIDEVIDPLHTRDRILTALNSYCSKEESRKKIIDSW